MKIISQSYGVLTPGESSSPNPSLSSSSNLHPCLTSQTEHLGSVHLSLDVGYNKEIPGPAPQSQAKFGAGICTAAHIPPNSYLGREG